MATIYQPIYLYPDDISLDMDNSHVFTSIVNGEKVTRYVLRIYNSSDTIVYEDDTSLSASEYVYNGETLEVTIPSANGCTNGNEYSWTITHYNGSANKMSYELPFTASTTPSLTITVPETVSSFGYDFNGTYSQGEDVPIKYWKYQLFNSEEELIEETDKNYSADISYVFSGLESGESYFIQGYGVTQDNQYFESTLYEFNVNYGVENAEVQLGSVSYDSDYIANLIEVNEIILEGIADGTYEYVDINYSSSLVDKGLSLDDNSILTYNVDIPNNFTMSFNRVFQSNFGESETLLDQSPELMYDIQSIVVYGDYIYAATVNVGSCYIHKIDKDNMDTVVSSAGYGYNGRINEIYIYNDYIYTLFISNDELILGKLDLSLNYISDISFGSIPSDGAATIAGGFGTLFIGTSESQIFKVTLSTMSRSSVVMSTAPIDDLSYNAFSGRLYILETGYLEQYDSNMNLIHTVSVNNHTGTVEVVGSYVMIGIEEGGLYYVESYNSYNISYSTSILPSSYSSPISKIKKYNDDFYLILENGNVHMYYSRLKESKAYTFTNSANDIALDIKNIYNISLGVSYNLITKYNKLNGIILRLSLDSDESTTLLIGYDGQFQSFYYYSGANINMGNTVILSVNNIYHIVYTGASLIVEAHPLST